MKSVNHVPNALLERDFATRIFVVSTMFCSKTTNKQ